MKAFFLRSKKLHLWLLADLALLAAFWLRRGNRQWMNALARHVTTPWRQAVGRLCYRLPFSVAEVLCVALAVFVAAYLVWSVAAVIRTPAHGHRAYSAFLGALCIAGTLYALSCLLWGVDYFTDSFQDRSGVYARDVAVEELEAVTRYFVQQLTETADLVERDETGLFAVEKEEILAASADIYEGAEALFPFLAFEDQGVKPIFFSRIMSIMDFTGVYCPFTGESNVNVDCPACLLPATIAHELSHQRSIASEQECNFLAVLAATTSGDPTYVYSGWLLGYIHLGNALYRADPEAYRAVWSSLPAVVQRDLTDNNAYWAELRDNVVQKASTTFYDGLLQSYGEERGMQSYGAVVDLLVVYYQAAAVEYAGRA